MIPVIPAALNSQVSGMARLAIDLIAEPFITSIGLPTKHNLISSFKVMGVREQTSKVDPYKNRVFGWLVSVCKQIHFSDEGEITLTSASC